MIVYLEPVSGTPKDSLERAKVEMERVLGFRGTISGARVEGKRIVVTIEINPKWDLPDEQKMANLEEWIRVKTRKFFKIV
jgi:hypothetical protein